MAENTLLPCPFCGIDPTPVRYEPHKHSITMLPDYPGAWSIECFICEVRIFSHESEQDAALKWNRRTPSQSNGGAE